MDFSVGLYSHPIFSSQGGFPESVKRRVAARSAEQGYPRSRLPEFTPEEIEYCKGTSDFYGFNHYSTSFVTRENFKTGRFPVPSFDDDLGAVEIVKDYDRGALDYSFIIPEGIRKCLNWVKKTCGNPKIMIMENGFNTFGGIKDLDRISYYQRYIDAVLDAIEIDGCNVVAYTAWSLMDNFEWNYGISIKFGLFEVDYEDENRKRTARWSVLWYKHLIETRALQHHYLPEFREICF
ncbi:unnamed protein product [Leptidea sinapis]|nr:unnamed protein product [Leptidea sinapis]